MQNIGQIIGKLGIVCGGGELPVRVITAAKQQNIPLVIAAIKGVTNKALVNHHNHFWISLGQVGALLDNFTQHGVTHICFAGAIKRPSILSLKLDNLGKELFKQYFAKVGGDNSLLSLIVNLFETRYGFKVVGAHAIDKSIIADIFPTQVIPSNYGLDIKLGFKIAKQIGSLDIGQSLVIQQQMIIAVEAVEGTDNLIKRSKYLLKKAGSKGILIKVKKPNQETRIDLPTIGINTIKNIKKAGLAGIAVEKGSTIILNPKEIISYANKYNLFLVAIDKFTIDNLIIEDSKQVK